MTKLTPFQASILACIAKGQNARRMFTRSRGKHVSLAINRMHAAELWQRDAKTGDRSVTPAGIKLLDALGPWR